MNLTEHSLNMYISTVVELSKREFNYNRIITTYTYTA